MTNDDLRLMLAILWSSLTLVAWLFFDAWTDDC